MLTSDLIATTRRRLYGAQRPELNKLSGDVTSTASTVTVVNDLGGIQAGAVVSVGLEDMYVWSVTGETATVERGYDGSPKTAHSDGDMVIVNPRFSNWELLGFINDDLNDLCSPVSGLYQIKTLDLTAVSAQVGYDFPAEGFLSVAGVYWKTVDPITKRWWPLEVEIQDSMPTADFPSGTALFIRDGMMPTPGQTIRVHYKARFDPLGDLDDDVTAVSGLADTALDLPPLGAAISAVAGRPVARAQYTSQGDSRRAAEVPTSDVLNSAAALRQQRQTRIAAEAARLAQQWKNMASRLVL